MTVTHRCIVSQHKITEEYGVVLITHTHTHTRLPRSTGSQPTSSTEETVECQIKAISVPRLCRWKQLVWYALCADQLSQARKVHSSTKHVNALKYVSGAVSLGTQALHRLSEPLPQPPACPSTVQGDPLPVSCSGWPLVVCASVRSTEACNTLGRNLT